MSEMNSPNYTNNGVKDTGTLCEGVPPGRCTPVRQRGPGRYPATVRTKWSKELNKTVMECFYRSNPIDSDGKPIRKYRQRMMREWKEHGMFDTTEQRLCDQARAIRKNGWLSELELEEIQRMISLDADRNNLDVEVDGLTTQENVIARASIQTERNTPVVNIETLDENERNIIVKLQEILTEGRNTNGISFKKVDQKRLLKLVECVNKTLKHIETTSITQTNNLIKAASVWVADQIGLKPFKGNNKETVPWWKRRIEGDIKQLRKDVSFLDRVKRNEVNETKKSKIKVVMKKYNVEQKGIKIVIEEIKQRILAKTAKIKRYDQRIQLRDTARLFIGTGKIPPAVLVKPDA